MTYLSIFQLMSSGHADLDRQRYDIVACREVAFDVAENFWGGFLYGVYCTGHGNDYELISR